MWSNFTSPLTTLLAALIVPVQYGLYIALLNRTRGSEDNLLPATLRYAGKDYGRLFVAGLLIVLFSTLVGIFTLGIGSIILSYAYRMVPYLLNDYPELSPREAMKISRQMMKGYKWYLFILDFFHRMDTAQYHHVRYWYTICCTIYGNCHSFIL